MLASLVLAYISVYVSPEYFWPLAFFGLAYPVFLGVNLFFLVFWAVRRKWLVLSTLAVLLAGWNFHKSFFRISFREQVVPAQTGGLKLLSYNVRMFNFYEWEDEPQSLNEIIRFVNNQDPGVLCLQEFYYSGQGEFTRANMLRSFGENREIHLNQGSDNQNTRYAGLATFSSYPVIRKATIVFPGTRNICMYTDILWNRDTVRIYNNHLQSIRLRKRPGAFLRNFDPLGDEENLEELKDISFRLKNAFVERARQVRVISEHIRKCPYPVIVCGDFNDTPISYTYFTMKKGLVDAFLGSGEGLGNTYRGNFPSYRIDYILHSPDLISARFQRHRVPLSDHYPVSCILFKKQD